AWESGHKPSGGGKSEAHRTLSMPAIRSTGSADDSAWNEAWHWRYQYSDGRRDSFSEWRNSSSQDQFIRSSRYGIHPIPDSAKTIFNWAKRSSTPPITRVLSTRAARKNCPHEKAAARAPSC